MTTKHDSSEAFDWEPLPDATPAAPAAPRGRLLVLAFAALVMAVVVGAVAWRTTTTDAPEEEKGPSASTPATGWPAAGASRTLTEVQPDGVLEVTHWIHTERPLDTLQLALPESVGRGTLVASEVEVVADGRPASGRDLITSFRASYVLGDATRILVRYQLAGAVELSSSAPGRGLVTTTALDVSAGQVREHRVIRSLAVLALACAAAPEAPPEPCGEREDDDQWSVQLTDRDATTHVVAVVTVST